MKIIALPMHSHRHKASEKIGTLWEVDQGWVCMRSEKISGKRCMAAVIVTVNTSSLSSKVRKVNAMTEMYVG